MGRQPASRFLVFAQVARVIMADGLEFDVFRRDFGEAGLGQDGFGHVLDGIFRDFVDERNVPVLAWS